MPRKPNGLYSSVDPHSPFAEAFRILRTNINFAGEGKPYSTILVTSALPKDGKSSTVANLGVVLAQAGQRVLIMDCDLRLGNQHRIFHLENQSGLTDIIINNVELDKVVKSTEIEGLQILTSGTLPPNPAELIGSKKMTDLIAEAREIYDMVLIDSPPLITFTDASLLAAMVDGVLLVMKSGSTKIEVAQEAKSILDKSNANIIGAVLNRIKIKINSCYYDYYCRTETKKRSMQNVAM